MQIAKLGALSILLTLFFSSMSQANVSYVDHRWAIQQSIPTSRDVVISPNGRLLVVVSESNSTGASDSGSLYVYLRDSSTGAVQFIQNYTRFDFTNLTRPQRASFSPDGMHLYVMNEDGNLLALDVLSNGSLDQSLPTYDASVGGFSRGIQVSPNGQWVVSLGAYSPISGEGRRVFLWERNTNTSSPNFGALTLRSFAYGGNLVVPGGTQVTNGLFYPYTVTFSEDSQNIYVVSTSSSLFPNGHALDAFEIAPTSTLLHLQTWREGETSGTTGVTLVGMTDPKDVIAFDVNPSVSYVVVGGTSSSVANVFIRNTTNGTIDPISNSGAGFSSSKVFISLDRLLLTGLSSGSAVHANFNTLSGGLSPRGTTTISGFTSGILFGSMGNSNNLLNVVGAQANTPQPLVAIQLNRQSTGNMGTVTQIISSNDPKGYDRLMGSSGLAANLVRNHIYAASNISNSFVKFVRNADGSFGTPTAYIDNSGGNNDLGGASDVIVSPEGDVQYVASQNDNAIVVYKIHPTSGNPVILQTIRNGESGTSGLVGVKKLAFSTILAGETQPRFLLAVSKIDNSLVIFSRDTNTASPTFGQLTFQARFTNGNSGVTGMASPHFVSTISSGQTSDVFTNIVVASSIDFESGSIASFRLNLSTGQTTFVSSRSTGAGAFALLKNSTSVAIGALKDTNGVTTGYSLYIPSGAPNGIGFDNHLIQMTMSLNATLSTTTSVISDNLLTGIQYAAVSSSGRTLLITSPIENRLITYQRDPTTGVLSNPSTYDNMSNGIIGMNQPRQMSISTIGGIEYVYIPCPGSAGAVILRLQEPQLNDVIFDDGFEN